MVVAIVALVWLRRKLVFSWGEGLRLMADIDEIGPHEPTGYGFTVDATTDGLTAWERQAVEKWLEEGQ